jgi:hypothetical protein
MHLKDSLVSRFISSASSKAKSGWISPRLLRVWLRIGKAA